MTSKLLSIAATTLLTANTAQAAASHRVVFESGGDRLVGDLYLPDHYQDGDRLPAVIVTGAWTTVKEQMPGRYASELADRGYAALAFDFRGWGQSEGGPRQVEHPTHKTEDILAAAAFLATRAEVDPERIGGLGICASAGYMAFAAGQSEHIRSLALVAPWMHDAAIVEQVYGGKDGVQNLIAASRQAEQHYNETGQPTMLPAASTTDESAVMFNAPYYTEKDRGLIPEYVNQFNVASWEPWLTFDAIKSAEALDNVPVLMVHSEAAAIPQGIRAFAAELKGSKHAHWLDGVSQFDFYDNNEAVTTASDNVAEHFAQTLDRAGNAEGKIDTAALKTVIESVGTLADRGDFTGLEKLFAPEVMVDYSSLTGQPAELMSPQVLMTQWAGVLPGFDRTRHALSRIQVRINGAEAAGTAQVVAGHWIGDAYWEVNGSYDYRFAKGGEGWRITAITLNLASETGSRDVFGPAMGRAQASPNAYLARQQTRQAVIDFLEGLEQKDMDRVNSVWAEDAVQDMPYAPEGFPQRVAGRDNLIKHYSGWPTNAGEASFTRSLVFYPTQDPQVVIAEFHGVCEIVPTGRTYDQRYIGLFHVEGGKIKLFREYFNPAVFAYAFKLDGGTAASQNTE